MPIERACCRYGPDVYRLSLDLVARGSVNLKSLITHRFVPCQDCSTLGG